MIYVFDTSSFIVLKNYYPATFPTLWANLERLAQSGVLASVREVFNELHNYNDTDFIQDWAARNKTIFATPSNDELLFVQRILAVPHFQMLIGGKAILRGTPVADPFVVAVAQGAVVTQESLKPHASRIPNVCEYFRIPCINLEAFMVRQGWTF